MASPVEPVPMHIGITHPYIPTLIKQSEKSKVKIF
jgi:hypothetical protein